MSLGIGILGTGLVAGVWAILLRHLGWSRVGASLTAFAIGPLIVLAYGYAIDNPIAGGLFLMLFLPIAILVGFAGVGLALLGEILLKAGGAIDRDGDEN